MSDDLDIALAALLRPPLDDAARARALSAARIALEPRARVDQWASWVERAYGWLEPAVVLMVAVIDVSWAVSVMMGG